MWNCNRLLVGVICLSGTLFLPAPAALAATYYVDFAKGSDSAAGGSPEKAWQSLTKVNQAKFRPGDQVLFRSGAVWKGQLAPSCSGAEGAPIVFDRYGEGSLPRIDGEGKVEDALRLYNVQQIEVRHLEVTNQGSAPANRRGVHIFIENYGTAKHIRIYGLYIHHVNGNHQAGAHNTKDTGGIIFRTRGSKVPSRFEDLVIERNIVWKVDRSAIAADSEHAPRNRWFPSLQVVLRDNLVEEIGGDGIVPWATEGVLVEHNIARHCNRHAQQYNAGIWPWSTDNSLFQLNEAAFTHSTLDGQGFDSDYNSRNTLFQYNYSHDNEGGFMLICADGKNNPAEMLGNTGTVVRFNISRNDRSRIFHLSAVDQTLVHDNAVYIGPGLDVQLLLLSNWNGWANQALFRNNIFHAEGTARYGHAIASAPDGTFTIGPGYGPAKEIVFEGNRYVGHHLDRPADVKAMVETASPVPSLDWQGPEFDPSHPEGFDEFMGRHRAWIVRLMEQQFGKIRLGR